ncbi:DUF3592 domain-containing protein [Streptomyces griseus]|uniref:DUF3592 domain-containing protein n=1 Tax=Streptomyces griseus TaxID=1911 RepID=UPI00056BF411|nr:DUF3592 domain-containing protein [Streptomyces griseus]
MEVFFYIVPLFIIAGAVFAAVSVTGRSRQVGRAWNSGFTAEARCLRSYTTTSGGGGSSSVSTTRHHVYEFVTRDGRPVRFEEKNGPGTIVEGDIVTVFYTPDRPEHATAHAPARGKLAASTGCALALCGMVVAFCVFFMVTAHLMFAAEGDFPLP